MLLALALGSSSIATPFHGHKHIAATISGVSRNASNISTLDAKPFKWSCLGDSWASGVFYGLIGRTDYDGNKDSCLRITQAYAPQMSRDSRWIPEGRAQTCQVQACSSTRWRQIDEETHLGHIQLDDVPENTDMIVFQAGGNNANFANIAYACIFAPQGYPNLGPEYPDPTGLCYKEIELADRYIYGWGRDQLFQDARWIVNTIFAHPKVKNNPKFRLSILGYFQFFYDQGGAGDWCDNASFAVSWEPRPKLRMALRKKINELIRGLNAGVKAGVEGSWYPERAHFIDVDSGIQGGKFCQPGHSIYDQYFGSKVLL
ncbi:SGNH hydrolase-type esterase domain-containing protein [Paraphoma chrysanthemicola]|nr:SGNH hydrolase-type esterase domain-containing protein [Paraphoma chrysanthemicola]